MITPVPPPLKVQIKLITLMSSFWHLIKIPGYPRGVSSRWVNDASSPTTATQICRWHRHWQLQFVIPVVTTHYSPFAPPPQFTGNSKIVNINSFSAKYHPLVAQIFHREQISHRGGSSVSPLCSRHIPTAHSISSKNATPVCGHTRFRPITDLIFFLLF